MLLSPLPGIGITNFTVYEPTQDTTTSRGWQTWLKPPGASWISIILVSGGGGAAGGQSTAGTARAGGGGGGCSGIIRYLIPAFALPDVLYVRPGLGGAGGAAATDGTVGTQSIVAVAPQANANYYVANAPGGALGAAIGTAGSGASAGTFSPYGSSGVGQSVAGQAGGAGGVNTGAVGTDITAPSTLVLTGGCGGASSGTGNNVFAGGAVQAFSPGTGPALYRPVAAGTAGVSGSVVGGAGGYGQGHGCPIAQMLSRNQPMLFSGGAGGGSGGASNGGRGGDGAWGCGGAGGGAGAVGGGGGRGGDGFVIIGAF